MCTVHAACLLVFVHSCSCHSYAAYSSRPCCLQCVLRTQVLLVLAGAGAQHYQVSVRAGEAQAVTWDGSRLYWFDEAPQALQFNPYVKSGYRAGKGTCQEPSVLKLGDGRSQHVFLPFLLVLCAPEGWSCCLPFLFCKTLSSKVWPAFTSCLACSIRSVCVGRARWCLSLV